MRRRPFDLEQTTYARARLAATLGDLPAGLALVRQALNEGVSYGTTFPMDPRLASLQSEFGLPGAPRAPRVSPVKAPFPALSP